MSPETATDISSRAKALCLNSMQTRLFAEGLLGVMIKSIGNLDEGDAQKVSDALFQKLRARGANRKAATA